MKDFEKTWEKFVREISSDEEIVMGRRGWKRRVQQIAEKKFPELLPYVDWNKTKRKFKYTSFRYYLQFWLDESLIFSRNSLSDI